MLCDCSGAPPTRGRAPHQALRSPNLAAVTPSPPRGDSPPRAGSPLGPSSPAGGPRGPLPVGVAGPCPHTQRVFGRAGALCPSPLGWPAVLQALYAPDPLLSPSCCWRRVGNVLRGGSLSQCCLTQRGLPAMQRWRPSRRTLTSTAVALSPTVHPKLRTPLLQQRKQLCCYTSSSRQPGGVRFYVCPGGKG